MRTAIENENQTEEFKEVYSQTYKRIVDQIKEEMDRRGYTQDKIGQMVGLCQPAVARILNPKYCPRFDTLYKILVALDLEIQVEPKN